MNSADIREAFLSYFEEHGHQRVASSSLVPGNDPTLLFTNAGMVQFKDVFLGTDPRSYSRATTSQRCVRAGGKHNDLENVGYTARHHTFFEMLGNFSFGDYFKREAIQFAWQFLTETLGLPEEKLWVTVYKDDQEAEDIWLKEMGVSPERFSRLGEKDNFWSMGDTGPCGPCSELFYDHGPDVPGGPPGSPDEDGDRYIEIWNLVFMQFNRAADGSMSPLPKPSVDTGMGLERIAAVMQHVHSNYDIDLFQALLAAVAEVCGVQDKTHNSLKVVADHIRSCAFMVLDDVVPSNEGRGYVLRRILRRAVRHGNKLGASGAFFHKLVPALVEQMGAAYPELAEQESHISSVLEAEETQFAKTLDQGMRILEQDLNALSGTVISGETAFRLYDTFGFPVDLTADIARERNLTIDMIGFEACMEKQRSMAKAAGQFSVDYASGLQLDGETEFTGYELLEQTVSVTAIVAGGDKVEQLQAGEQAILILDATPFYAESGGQVGDTGLLQSEGLKFRVTNTSKLGAHHAHHGELLEGTLAVGKAFNAVVDRHQREATARNHSATHLLHAALRNALGDHVTQKGSLVDADRLRFDFSNNTALSAEVLQRIEDEVNREIRNNSPVQTELMPIDQAMEKGAMALFGEKYGEQVRVLTMGGNYSVELCGGTHVSRTGDIGLLRLTSESGISAGVRRIEAVTGERAFVRLRAAEQQVEALAEVLKTDAGHLEERARQLLSEQKQLHKQLDQLKLKVASSAGSDLSQQVENISDVPVLAVSVPGVDAKALRGTLDQLKDKLGNAVIFLASEQNGRLALICGVTKDLSGQYPAGSIMRDVAPLVGGKGGGRDDMAQGAGSDPSGLTDALQAVKDWVAQRA
ncbi:MAG: alanine--tRNA ligase [Pseudomonadales bacterium]